MTHTRTGHGSLSEKYHAEAVAALQSDKDIVKYIQLLYCWGDKLGGTENSEWEKDEKTGAGNSNPFTCNRTTFFFISR